VRSQRKEQKLPFRTYRMYALEESRPFALDRSEFEFSLDPIASRDFFRSDLDFLLFRLRTVIPTFIRHHGSALQSITCILVLVAFRAYVGFFDGRIFRHIRRLRGFVVPDPEPVCVEGSRRRESEFGIESLVGDAVDGLGDQLF
jgi:hypothetical protein